LDLQSRRRGDLRHILRAAVDAIEPGGLVRAALSRGALATLPSTSIYLVAAGKAAWPMARAVGGQADADGLPPGEVPATRTAHAVVAGPRGEGQLPSGFEWFDAAHPYPNAASEAAGRRALAAAAESRQDGVLVVLLSGGASSLLAVPAGGLSLQDKIVTARALMNAGVPIADLNCVRKHLSAIKGGRLAAAARRSVTLAISDVHGAVPDDPSVIGSGPTVADPTTFAEALSIVREAGVATLIPSAVVARLERGADETPAPGDPRLAESSYEVIGTRHLAMEGAARAARARGYEVDVIPEASTGEARTAGAAFAAEAWRRAATAGRPLCVIASGETTVRVTGTGRGGRNQEFALGAMPVVARGRVDAVLGSAGTDGVDGPTDAAGAIVDSSSSARAAEGGLDANAALSNNAAYDFFLALGDLIVWGPTGTNVGDIHVMLTGG
jgi:glycerate 2-kinase